MAAPKPETRLADAIKNGRFEPVYCLFGENEFRKDEAIRQMIAAATDPATRDFNVDTLRGGEIDAQVLETTLSTLPMMSERRVVVLRDPPALKKSARTMLDRYLENPAGGTILVLRYAADAEVPAAIGGKSVAIEVQSLSGERLLKWIAKQSKAAHGVEIEPAAADLLVQVVGNDLVELAAEIDKLASYADGQRIDAAAVSAAVGIRPGETPLDLMDAVVARDVKRALQLVAPVLRQPKVTGVTVVMTLAVQLLAIGWCRARRDAGVSGGALEREAFAIARRIPYFLAGRPAGANATAWTRASSHWEQPDVEAALDALLAADAALKETRVASDEQIVSTTVLAICAGAARRVAA